MSKTGNTTIGVMASSAVVLLGVVFATGCGPAEAEGGSTPPAAAVSDETRELAEWLSELEHQPQEQPVLAPTRLRNPFAVDNAAGRFVVEPVETPAPQASEAPVGIAPDAERWWEHTEWLARALTLETVLYGSRPLVTVRGEILGIGDAIELDGVVFVVRSIERRAVVLAAEEPSLGFSIDDGTGFELRLSLEE